MGIRYARSLNSIDGGRAAAVHRPRRNGRPPGGRPPHNPAPGRTLAACPPQSSSATDGDSTGRPSSKPSAITSSGRPRGGPVHAEGRANATPAALVRDLAPLLRRLRNREAPPPGWRTGPTRPGGRTTLFAGRKSARLRMRRGERKAAVRAITPRPPQNQPHTAMITSCPAKCKAARDTDHIIATARRRYLRLGKTARPGRSPEHRRATRPGRGVAAGAGPPLAAVGRRPGIRDRRP